MILLGFEGVFGWDWVIFGVVGRAKTLIFQGFVELGIELKMGVEA